MTKPSNIPYYIRKVDGGYSDACKGSPTDPTATVLANCVGYANGRFAEIIGKPCIEYQLVCNAENFIERAVGMGLQISSVPTLGGIMVWQKGSTLGGKDGAGHVAVVEQIIDANTIITSESGYNAKSPFWTQTRTNTNGRWGQSSEYKFRGCIINPAVHNGYWLNGCDYSPVFDPVYYVNKYPDLMAAFGMNANSLWLHFQLFGMNEFRQASEEFDPKAYKERYSDLVQAYGDNNPMYYWHYCYFGKAEGRIGT
jgi:surface antigen